MKQIIDAFTTHPREAGENYFEHLLFTLKMALRVIACGGVLVIHGLLPFLFVKKASDMMQGCQKTLCDRKDKVAKSDAC